MQFIMLCESDTTSEPGAAMHCMAHFQTCASIKLRLWQHVKLTQSDRLILLAVESENCSPASLSPHSGERRREIRCTGVCDVVVNGNVAT